MQMLKNILGSNKGYYLELDESKEKVVETVSKAADTVKEQVVEVAQSQPVQKAVAATSEVITEDKPAAKKPAQVKQNGKVAKSDPKPQPAKVSPKNSGASSYDPPFWVAAMYKNSNTTDDNGSTDSQPTFASDNLMPTITKYRRRPGGSLGKFRDMAKQAKTPKG